MASADNIVAIESGEQRPQGRRLTALLMADVAEYGRLVEEDEEGTIASLQRLRRSARAAIQQCGGRVISTPGDAIIAEFASALNATDCALTIQRALSDNPITNGRNHPIALRIGLHACDVVPDGTDVLGEGINLTSRIVSVARPGGIVLTGAIFEQIRSKIDFYCLDLGEHTLKHVSHPVRIFEIDLLAGSFAARVGQGAHSSSLASAVILPAKTIIAVLRFDDLGGGASSGYWADAVSEGVIDALAQSRWFFVVSRASSFGYRSGRQAPSQIAHELGAHYLVSGSVSLFGDSVRVTVQLVEPERGIALWSHVFQSERSDLATMHADIVLKVAGSLEPELLASASRRQHANGFRNDRVLKAYSLIWSLTREGCEAAATLLEEARRADPKDSQAAMGLALARSLSIYMGWAADPERTLEEALTNARGGVHLDRQNAWARLALGTALLQACRVEEAIGELRRALRFNPSFAMAYGTLGQALVFDGRFADARGCLRMSMRLSVNDPFMVYWQVAMAVTHFLNLEFDAAADWAQLAATEQPLWPGGHRLLAMSYAMRGDAEAAAGAYANMSRLQPNLPRAYLERLLPFRQREHFDLYLDGMRKAGWSE